MRPIKGNEDPVTEKLATRKANIMLFFLLSTHDYAGDLLKVQETPRNYKQGERRSIWGFMRGPEKVR